MKKTRYLLGSGIGLTAVCDKRFKNEFLSVNFLTPLKGSENALSYLISSVLARGCEKYQSMQQINAMLEEAYDGEIGTDTYKFGNTRVIRFGSAWLRNQLTFDNSSPKNTVLDILRQIILFPLKNENGTLSEKFTELEKISLIDCAESEINNKRGYAFKKCLSLHLQGDDFAHSKYGTIEEIQAVTTQSLTEFYNRMIREFPIEIYYHGHTEEDVIFNDVKEYFSELICDKAPLDTKSSNAVTCCDEVSEYTENGDCEQTVLVMGFSVPNTKEEKFPFIMTCEILGYSPINRLFTNVREKRGLCYYCDITAIRNKHSAFITAGLELKRINEAKKAILDEIEDIALGNIEDDELKIAKASAINGYSSLFDSPKDHESIVLQSVLGSDYLSLEEFEAEINSVTRQHIQAIAKKMTLKTVFTLSEEK